MVGLSPGLILSTKNPEILCILAKIYVFCKFEQIFLYLASYQHQNIGADIFFSFTGKISKFKIFCLYRKQNFSLVLMMVGLSQGRI
jgi:hypothetical protein